MNVLCRKTSALDVDPFSQSDRIPTNGKGDRNRSANQRFKDRFPESMGKVKNTPGKTTYRY